MLKPAETQCLIHLPPFRVTDLLEARHAEQHALSDSTRVLLAQACGGEAPHVAHCSALGALSEASSARCAPSSLLNFGQATECALPTGLRSRSRASSMLISCSPAVSFTP